MAYFIGIDIGASFIKAGLLDLNSRIVSNLVKYPSPTSLRNNIYPGRFEVNCNEYEKLIKKIITMLVKESAIEGIVFSTQMHGMVLVNNKLNPVTPFIGWQDERLLEFRKGKKTWMDLLKNRLTGVNTKSTGIIFRPGLMGATLFWLRENKILRENMKALFLGDYIAAKLTNGKIAANPTNACGSGLFDVKRNIWDKKIIEKLKIYENNLPEVVHAGYVVGHIKMHKQNIPVYTSIGDLQAACLGSLLQANKRKEALINIGTGSQVSYVSSKFNLGNYDIRSYFDNEFLYTITHIPAGRALSVVIKFIEDIERKFFKTKTNKNVWEQLKKLLIMKSNSEGIRGNMYFFKNNISKDTSVSITDITEKNFTIENIFFALLENMAQNYWTACQRLRINKYDRIVFSGGLIRKMPVLQRFIEKFFNKKISLVQYTEETLAGLFIFSLVCRGDFSKVNDAIKFVRKNPIRFA